MKVYSSILTGLLAFNALLSFGQAGTLDGDFDGDGKVITGFLSNGEIGRAAAIQQDGKIVVVGSSDNDFIVARYNPDGSLDNTFGNSGHIITVVNPNAGEEFASSVAIQQDGKIVVAGRASQNFAVVRYNTNGGLDNTFDSDGIVTTDFGGIESVGSMAIQADGKILVAGSILITGMGYDFAVARYNTNGSLDNTFSFDGKVTSDFGNSNDQAKSVSIQTDGKILIAGHATTSPPFTGDFATVRLNIDGTLDNSFGINGKITTDFSNRLDLCESAFIQPDGKIVLGGISYSNGSMGDDADIAVLRYNVDGSLDNTFNNDGKVITAFGLADDKAYSVALQPDGKILLAGSTNNGTDLDAVLARYTSSGMLDNTFQSGHVTLNFGSSTDEAKSVVVQPDGKIIIAGYTYNGNDFDIVLARYISGLSVGVVNFLNEANPPLIYPNPINHKAKLEFELIKDEVIDILLYDINGKLIQSIMRNVEMIEGQNEIELNFNNSITTGNYLLVVKSAAGQQGIKITIE
jgi:uncharacterized delta-60 repeat protein